MPKANTYFYTSHGCYSDYGVGKHYKVLKDFIFIDICKEWIILNNIDSSKIEFGKNSFRFRASWDDNDLEETNYFNYLVETGYIEELEFLECHTGDYGETLIEEM